MPKSRVRKKDDYTPPPSRDRAAEVTGRWVVPTMVTLLLLGLLWIILYYITEAGLPGMDALGGWNLAIGMAFIVGGFLTATKWK